MNSKIIIYGAGEFGKGLYRFLKMRNLELYVAGFCGQNSDVVTMIEDKRVYSFEEAMQLGNPFVIGVGTQFRKEVEKNLKDSMQKYYGSLSEWALSMGYDMVGWNRDFCAFFHIESMDSYFEDAESEKSLDVFWGGESPFYAYFKELDLNNVIELACGKGRHVPYYADKSGNITLVDILDKNISFCKTRFSDYTNIHYYCNDGFSLSDLSSDSYSALFTYDAMVHFEMMDIFHYLKDIHRVLKPGGKALFHHSNNDSDYTISFATGKQGRNFMSKNIFAYMSHRAGFKIIAQKVIDWMGDAELDCITLLEK